ncbi:MAG: phosphate ABC transporter substrate-binding protein PstS family protein [Thiotrichaceae bacterium]|nr:phosphate ABC transporter substrate-binding protein PstS family protein [Thiotrichaceae bacterium]
MKKLASHALLATVLSGFSSFASGTLLEYKPVSGISGTLSSVGSDTLATLMTGWLSQFKRSYPNVNIQIQAAGSSTAPASLTDGMSNLAPMSRAMKDQELEAFEKKFGYKPTRLRIAIDAVVVYTHKDNPIRGLSIEQVDAIFSATRQCGGKEAMTQWKQLGLTGAWESLPIQLFGRNAVSGSYGYFKEHALCKGDFRVNVNEQPGSSSVVQSVNNSLNSIGYSSIGYKTAGVKMLPLARKTGEAFIEPTDENILSGSYPLSRYLYLYVNKAPNKLLQPLESEFIKLIFSKQGQALVKLDGYTLIPDNVLMKELEKLQ